MRRSLLFILCFLFLSASGLCQSTATESLGMQALVAEVHQLRKDLQTTNANALRVQLLLYRLQAQEATVRRASEHLNEARARLAGTQRRREEVTATLKRFEESIDNAELSPADRKQVQQEGSRNKAELESLAAEEQQRQTAEMEAEEQLRAEQAKLSGLEDRVDRLEKELENPH